MTPTTVSGGRNRDRMVEPAPQREPFYSFGNTWRGPHKLLNPGFYYVDGTTLHGPFATKALTWDEVRKGK